MNLKTIVISVLLLGLTPSLYAADSPGPAKEGPRASSGPTVNGPDDRREEALLRKKSGDDFASREDYKNASEEYLAALGLSPSSFTVEERIGMATMISWADRLDDAARVLRAVLIDAPENREARVQLARVLAWADKLDEAGAAADEVLRAYPGDQAALLVKADVLRWSGRNKEAAVLYEQVLDKGEVFEARLGLAHALLALGDKEAAKRNSSMLKPRYPHQEKDLQKLNDALRVLRPDLPGVLYSHYSDSDKNRVNKYALTYGFWYRGWESELLSGYDRAVDLAESEQVERLSIKSHTRSGAFDSGVGLGVVHNDSAGNNLVFGHAKSDLDLGWGSVGMLVARDALTDTALLIKNEITRTSGMLSLSQRPLKQLTFAESYSYASYSDDNGADDIRATARYRIFAGNANIDAGYRYRFWDFRRQSRGGYFDPQDFTVHQVFLSLYAERRGFYAFLEPYVGTQSFNRYGEKSSGTIGGASASAGWTSKGCTSFEINAEGGNYAGATAAGFRYYQVGFKLSLIL